MVHIQLNMKDTHGLKSQGKHNEQGLKSRSQPNPLTSWKAKDMGHEQGPDPAHHQKYPPTGKPRTGIMSTIQI